MTQEELDALMGGDEEMPLDGDLSQMDESDLDDLIDENHHTLDANEAWPPPATDEHRVVYQLDDVTKESEQKAGEVFDKLDMISNDVSEIEANVSSIDEILGLNIDTLEKLSAKFANVETFKVLLEKNNEAKENIAKITEHTNAANDAIIEIMDIMQYTDMHRQKIERVINVMRALSNYMNNLLSAKVDDKTRVKSAVHIAGDNKASDDLAGEDDIEALIAAFGKKE